MTDFINSPINVSGVKVILEIADLAFKVEAEINRRSTTGREMMDNRDLLISLENLGINSAKTAIKLVNDRKIAP